MKTVTPMLDWNKPRVITEVLSHMMDDFDDDLNRVKPVHVLTGFADLDRVTMGLRPGSVVVVAGRPSFGKTAFSFNIASHSVLEQKLPTLIFSMDMSSKQVAARLVCQNGRVDVYDFRVGKVGPDAKKRAMATIEKFKGTSLFIDETPALKVSEIISRAREIFEKHGRLGLVVIDYLQAISPLLADGASTKNYHEVMFGLRSLAKEINAPVVVLSQLNRKLEKRKNKRPRVGDLPSEAILQNADLLLFLYRDEAYDPDSPDKGIAEVIVGRNRHGPIGTIRLSFVGEFARFENLLALTND